MPSPRTTSNRLTYDDARMAAIYDIDNPDGEDHDFFRQVAREADARRIVDLGCGTGILTVTLADEGRSVIGIDPAAAMLEIARTRPGGQNVEWRLGTSELIDPTWADLVIMSGNVAMHLIDTDWHAALAHIAAGLAPNGRLVFETRNPVRRAWESWQQDPTERMTPAGRVIESETTTTPDRDGVVTMHVRTEFPDQGATAQITQHLQFRSEEQIRTDLAQASLRVERISRDWRRGPFDVSKDALMVVEARRA